MKTSETAKLFLSKNNFLILTHKNPDGDTLGSAAALCSALRRAGKTSYLFPNAEMTEKYREFARYRELLSGILEHCRTVRHAGKPLLKHLHDIPCDTPPGGGNLPFPAGLMPELPDGVLGRRIWRELLIESCYDGYLQRERSEIDRLARMEDLVIPETLPLETLPGLSNEARQKLLKVRPSTLGQASRIDGVTPADVALLQVAISAERRS